MIDFSKDTIAVISDDIVNLGAFIEEHKNCRRRKTEREPKIEQLFNITSGMGIENLDCIGIVGLQEIRKEAEKVTDVRNMSYISHKLGDILVIVLLAVLANCNSWYAIESFAKGHEKWLRKFLDLKNGVPSDDTYRIVLSNIDMDYVYQIIIGLLMKKIDAAIVKSGQGIIGDPDVIPIDGKAGRSSGRRETAENGGAKPLNTLNAYSNHWGFCLGQEFIEKKSNEIPAAPKLLDKIDVTGAIVTCDALNTQKKTAGAITAGGAMYIMPVKANQKTLMDEIAAYFSFQKRNEIKSRAENGQFYTRTEDKEHGAIVIREYYLSTDTQFLTDHEQWPGLSSIGLSVKTTVSLDSSRPVKEEHRLYICGGITEARHFARSGRLHWGVENGLHWQLDFTFKDDANKSMADTGAKPLQLFKKAGMCILKAAKVLFPAYRSMNDIRLNICHDFENIISKIFSILAIETLLEEEK